MAETVPVPLPPGLIAVERRNGRNVLRMAGEIDAGVVAAFEAQHTSSDTPVIDLVDLTEVAYLSSTGIGLLLRHTRSARERGDIPTLHGVSRQAGRLLELAGVAGLFQLAAGTPGLL